MWCTGNSKLALIIQRPAKYADGEMAFAMSLPRTKRVKYIEPDGREVYQEEDRWTLVRAVHNEQVKPYLLL